MTTQAGESSMDAKKEAGGVGQWEEHPQVEPEHPEGEMMGLRRTQGPGVT